MPLEYMNWYTKQLIRSNPDKFYIFGDNFAERGLGGQAREARGEPNSIGIYTKRYSSYNENAFLKDSDLPEWKSLTVPRLTLVLNVLQNNKIIVWPLAGIGTGLAELDKRAPLIMDELRGWIDRFLEYETKSK